MNQQFHGGKFIKGQSLAAGLILSKLPVEQEIRGHRLYTDRYRLPVRRATGADAVRALHVIP